MKLSTEVEWALEKYPETRNCDIHLQIKIWRELHSVSDSIKLTELFTLPRLDHITRIRRKIQNEEGKWLPTEWEVAKARKIEEDRWRTAMGYPPLNAQGQNAML